LSKQVISTYTGVAKSFAGLYKKDIKTPIDYPPVALAFDNNKITENNISKITALGLTEDTFGRVRYFKGPVLKGKEAFFYSLGSKTSVLTPLDVDWFSEFVYDLHCD